MTSVPPATNDGVRDSRFAPFNSFKWTFFVKFDQVSLLTEELIFAVLYIVVCTLCLIHIQSKAPYDLAPVRFLVRKGRVKIPRVYYAGSVLMVTSG